MRKSPIVLVSALAALVGSGSTVAVVSHSTQANANLCSPATNDLTRSTNGIRNNTTGPRSVYCSFEVREGGIYEYALLGVTLRNYGEVERTVTCYWTSGQPHSGGYATATIVYVLAPDGGLPHADYAYDVVRPSAYAALVLRCALPPGVAMDLIEVGPYEPS